MTFYTTLTFKYREKLILEKEKKLPKSKRRYVSELEQFLFYSGEEDISMLFKERIEKYRREGFNVSKYEKYISGGD